MHNTLLFMPSCREDAVFVTKINWKELAVVVWYEATLVVLPVNQPCQVERGFVSTTASWWLP